ncbi:hypothetical protein HIMB100_00012500 [SAR116 cluster alpha proteobacterium HIMB100]|nr:hypothetical protein HIMB100_00012500 [SAR116 cluster alpha proteobacterium HIMB100]
MFAGFAVARAGRILFWPAPVGMALSALLFIVSFNGVLIDHYNGSHMNIADAYPKFEQRQFYWIDPFNDKASEEHHAIKRKIQKREYSSLEDFYLALQPLLKPQKKVRLLKM